MEPWLVHWEPSEPAEVTVAIELSVTDDGGGAGVTVGALVGVVAGALVGASDGVSGAGAAVDDEAGFGATVGRVMVMGIQPLVVPTEGN